MYTYSIGILVTTLLSVTLTLLLKTLMSTYRVCVTLKTTADLFIKNYYKISFSFIAYCVVLYPINTEGSLTVSLIIHLTVG